MKTKVVKHGSLWLKHVSALNVLGINIRLKDLTDISKSESRQQKGCILFTVRNAGAFLK